MAEAGAGARQRNPLAKALILLTQMVDLGQESYGLRQLADAAEYPPSTVHRLLGLLEGTGMVTQSPGGDYTLGLEFFRLAWRATQSYPIKGVALDELAGLQQATGESTSLALLHEDGTRMMFVARKESDHEVRYVSELNAWLPLLPGATGLAILADLPADLQQKLLADPELFTVDGRRASERKVRLEELRSQIERVREQGYALTASQRTQEAVGLAAAIRGSDNRVLGAISVTVPLQRYTESDEQRLSEQVVACAARVSHILGADDRG